MCEQISWGSNCAAWAVVDDWRGAVGQCSSNSPALGYTVLKYFIMPRYFPKVEGTTCMTEQDRKSSIALLTLVAQQSQLSHNVTLQHGIHITNEQPNMYEGALSAASICIKNRVMNAVKSTAYRGTQLTWKQGKLTFVAPRLESSRLLGLAER